MISSKNYDAVAISYGVGGGLVIRVYQGRKKKARGYIRLISISDCDVCLGGGRIFEKGRHSPGRQQSDLQFQ